MSPCPVVNWAVPNGFPNCKCREVSVFGRYLKYTIAPINRATSAEKQPAPYAFQVLLKAQLTLQVPKKVDERTGRDRLKNKVVEWLEQKNLGWSTGETLRCSECLKPRVLCAQRKLKGSESLFLMALLTDEWYSCGSLLSELIGDETCSLQKESIARCLFEQTLLVRTKWRRHIIYQRCSTQYASTVEILMT